MICYNKIHIIFVTVPWFFFYVLHKLITVLARLFFSTLEDLVPQNPTVGTVYGVNASSCCVQVATGRDGGCLDLHGFTHVVPRPALERPSNEVVERAVGIFGSPLERPSSAETTRSGGGAPGAPIHRPLACVCMDRLKAPADRPAHWFTRSLKTKKAFSDLACILVVTPLLEYGKDLGSNHSLSTQSTLIFFKLNKFKFKQISNLSKNLSFESEQKIILNKFWTPTKFYFEQISNLSKIYFCTNFESEQNFKISNLSKQLFWTNFESKKILILNKFWIWAKLFFE
jgi:hypothetical protein